MTTREEYAEAANLCSDEAMVARHMQLEGSDEYAEEFKHEADLWAMSARVLRAMADGAVLCDLNFEIPSCLINGRVTYLATIRQMDPQP